MKIYIKENNSFLLFFIHVLLPMLEIIAVINVSSFANSKFVASTFAMVHIALISFAYRKSLSGFSLNYVLSLGKTRVSIYRDLVGMYMREILIYTTFVIGMLFVIQPSNALIYIMTRVIFSMVVAPIFLYNSMEFIPASYAGILVFYLLGRINLGYLLLVSVPITIYLITQFKKKIIKGNLI